MRFAEVILRVGVGLVAWMLLYAHVLWLAALRNIGCGPDGSEIHAVLTGLAPLTIAAAFLIRASRPLAEVHSMLRWFAIPLALLMPLAAWSIVDVFRTVNLGGLAICSASDPVVWHHMWAPVQAAVLILVATRLVQNHRLS